MGTTIDAVKLVLISVLSTSPWLRDPNVVKMPWNSDAESSTLARANADGSAKHAPLKIGIYWTDGVVTPHPPVRRGLRVVQDALQGLRHKVKHMVMDDVSSHRQETDRAPVRSLTGIRLRRRQPTESM